MSWRQWVSTQAGNERRYLTFFSIGATLFFAGAGLILLANKRIAPSFEQEAVAMTGLLCAGAGALLASIGYIMLTILRLFRDPTNHD
jgi:nitrate reductase gamma subunit